MSETFGEDARVRLMPGFRLQWEPAQNAHVLLYPEGMVKLNASASEILKYCDGSRTTSQIVAELQTQFPEAELEAEVHQFLDAAYAHGWIKPA